MQKITGLATGFEEGRNGGVRGAPEGGTAPWQMFYAAFMLQG